MARRAYGLEDFAQEFEALASSEREHEVLLEKGQAILRKLLPNQQFVCDLLAEILSSEHFPDHIYRTVDSHDFTLYRSPQGSFSLKLYVWVPSLRYPIHDHGAWGVVGAYVNEVTVIKYQRLDDGSLPGYARLREKERQTLRPGETTSVLPLDQGIHWTGGLGKSIALSLHAYGRALRKGYIQRFDIEASSAYPMCTPTLDKTLFAVRALGALGEPARAALEAVLSNRYPLARWEGLMALERLDPALGRSLIERAANDESEEVRVRARAYLRPDK